MRNILNTFGNIEVEKVAIQDGLNDPSNYSNPVLEIFAIITVDPVEDVEGTIGAQSKQVVRCDRFSFSSLD